MSTDPASTRAWIQRSLPEYGYAPAPAQLDRLTAYLDLVIAANARVRLVGAAEPEVLARRHLGESLFLGTLLPLHRQRLLDLGSGAGFPGLALALAWPELKTTLVESTGKKAAFLQSVVTALELASQVRVENVFVPRRPPASAEAAPLPTAQLITVRALEKMEEVPAWLGRWLAPGATAAFWVGETRATAWRRQYPAWHWSPFHRLPGSRERGIVLGSAL